MSVSIRPAYRSGRVPPAPPAAVAPVALLAALVIALAGAAYRQACHEKVVSPAGTAPTLVAPAPTEEAAGGPASKNASAPQARVRHAHVTLARAAA